MSQEAIDRAYCEKAYGESVLVTDRGRAAVHGRGRRRQAATPLRRRLRLDLLLWGVIAGVAAALALGLTGGGWVEAVVLGLLVVAGFAVLTLLTATSSYRPGRHSSPPPSPAHSPAPSPPELPGAGQGPSDGRDDSPDP
jgi:hypothetical protein